MSTKKLTYYENHDMIYIMQKHYINHEKGGENMYKGYKCSICGAQNVKLWRPEWQARPLICAECAEERQILKGDAKWQIDEEGNFLSESGEKTDKLSIELHSKETLLIPAIPCGKNRFWGYKALTSQRRESWKRLPTHKSEK